MKSQKIYIASDHAGYALKEHLKEKFPDWPWEDLGTDSEKSVDYPDFADQVAQKVESKKQVIGLLICGSGQGMCMRANKYPTLRAALCWNEESARLTRQHNDANILCLPSRMIPFEEAERILQVFVETDFEGGRHQRRVEKLSEPLS